MTERVTVYGVRETLNALRKVEPALYRESVAQIKSAGGSISGAVKMGLPQQAPLSGMNHPSRLRWTTPKVGVRYGGRKSRMSNLPVIPLIRAVIDGAAFIMADMAASARTAAGAVMITALGGSPSRWAWPAAEGQVTRAQYAVLRACDDVMEQVNDSMPNEKRW